MTPLLQRGVSERGVSLSPRLYSNSLERNGTLQDNTAQTSAYVQYEPHLLFSRYGWAPPLGPRADPNSWASVFPPAQTPVVAPPFRLQCHSCGTFSFKNPPFFLGIGLCWAPGVGARLRGCGCGRKVCATSCRVSVFSMHRHLFPRVLAPPSLNPRMCADHVPLGLRHGHDHVLPDSMSTQ